MLVKQDKLPWASFSSLSRPAARGHLSWKRILSHNGCLSSKFNSKSPICHCEAFGVAAEPPHPHNPRTQASRCLGKEKMHSHISRSYFLPVLCVTPEESLRNRERREKSGPLSMDWPQDGRPTLWANGKPSPPWAHCRRLQPGDAPQDQRGQVRAQGSPRQGLTPARLAQAAEG